MILFIVWQIFKPDKSVESRNPFFASVSENELNLKNPRHLDCQGIKGHMVVGAYNYDIPASQMSEPKIEIYFDNSWIYERTKYIDKKDNKFERFEKDSQVKEGVIKGWNFMSLASLNTLNNIEIYFNQNGGFVVRKVSTTTGDDVFTMFAYDYSCKEN